MEEGSAAYQSSGLGKEVGHQGRDLLRGIFLEEVPDTVELGDVCGGEVACNAFDGLADPGQNPVAVAPHDADAQCVEQFRGAPCVLLRE